MAKYASIRRDDLKSMCMYFQAIFPPFFTNTLHLKWKLWSILGEKWEAENDESDGLAKDQKHKVTKSGKVQLKSDV